MLEKIYKLTDWVKTNVQILLIGFTLGIVVTQSQALSGVIKDCQVLGAFRIGNVAFSCRQNPNFNN